MTELNFDLYGGQDPREISTYTQREAAHHVSLPLPAVRSWVRGRKYKLTDGSERHWPAIIDLATPPMLSFVNLVELHVLAAIRREYHIDLGKVRRAIKFLQKECDSKHPLATEEFATDAVDLFVERSGLVLNTSSDQLPIQEFIRAHLTRIDRDQYGRPLRMFPFVYHLGRPYAEPEALRKQPRLIAIDSFVSFGQPTISGTGIRTGLIAERFNAGDSVHFLSQDYNQDVQTIEAAIRFESLGFTA